MRTSYHGLIVAVAAAVVVSSAACQARANDAAGDDAAERQDIIVTTQLLAAPVAAKAEIPMLENIQPISILPQELLSDQGVRRISEALYNVAGVSRSNNYGFFDGFNIRGFNASSGATYLDGLLDDTGYATSEISALGRVEVVKGPASGLFGQGPISGIVNLVSKRPEKNAFLDLSIAGGAYDFKELTIDANAPLNSSGTLLARLSAVYRDQDFFVNASGQRRIFLAPALTWTPGTDTTLTLLGRYVDDHINPWSPTTAYGTALPNPNGPIDIKLSINDAEYPAVQDNDYWSLGYVFDHRFSEAIAIHQSLRYQDFHNSWDNWLFITGISPDYRRVRRAFYGPYSENGRYFRVDTNASARFDTGLLNHYVLMGIDYGWRSASNFNLYDSSMPYELDLYEPVYGTLSTHNPAVPSTTYASRTRQRGFYLQDHVKLGDALTLTIGGRWDRATSRVINNGTANPKVSDDAFSPRAGVTVALSDWISLYANYARSFNPQGTYRAADGSSLPPERGVNYEAGIKLARKDGSLTGMFTVFELTRTNVATADAVIPNVYVLTGEQRTRGVEAEAGWRPLPGVEFTGAFTYLDARVTADNRLQVGSRLGSIPRYIANIWARYTIQEGALANLGAGVGVHHEGDRMASTASAVTGATAPFLLKAYTLVDGAVFYSFGEWSAQANVRNVLNKRYFPTGSLTRTTPGEPRTFIVSISRRF